MMVKSPPNSPEPLIRTVSAETLTTLKHPTPDLQPIHGLSYGNIERLEFTAERMSLESDNGKDSGTATSRIVLAENRKPFLSSSCSFEGDTTSTHEPRSTLRNSCYADSIVGVNYTAQSESYSMHAMVSSQNGSPRSNPILQYSQESSQASNLKLRKASRLDQVERADEDREDTSASMYTNHNLGCLKPSRSVSRPSHSPIIVSRDQADSDYAIGTGTEITERFKEDQTSPVDDRDGSRNPDFANREGPDLLPQDDFSIDPKEQEKVFLDFDGSHHSYAEEDDMKSTQLSDRNLSVDIVNGLDESFGNITEETIIYPARLPISLNLPKRLSQIPDHSLNDVRRSKALGLIAPGAGSSCPWIEDNDVNNKSSSLKGASKDVTEAHTDSRYILTAGKLPPQLRASAFFDQIPKFPKCQPIGESAVENLDCLLEASINAPANVFTHHAFLDPKNPGASGKRDRTDLVTQSPASATATQLKNTKNRRSFMFFKRSNNRKVKNLSEDLDPGQISERDDSGPDVNINNIKDEKVVNKEGESLEPHMFEECKMGAIDDDQNDCSQAFSEGAPSTLLAELQARKHQLQKRTRTAPTASSNGMHTTLLQLDAVAQIEKKRRTAQRVKLAWEEPETGVANGENDDDDDEDDDVPLGMLFAGQSNGERDISDWKRPLGLIQSKHLEDNEPLSARRNRLYGTYQGKSIPQLLKQNIFSKTPNIYCSGVYESDDDDDDDDDDETLAQRLRRLRKDKDAGAASVGIDNMSGSEWCNNRSSRSLGLNGAKESSLSPNASPDVHTSDDEGETLGQRRKRLQADVFANLRKSNNRSAIDLRVKEFEALPKKTRSMVDLLQAPSASVFRRVSNDELKASLAPGSLLQQSETRQEKHRSFILEQNNRNSYTTEKILPNVQLSRTPSPSIVAQQERLSSKPNYAAFTSGQPIYNSTDSNVSTGLPDSRRKSELVSNAVQPYGSPSTAKLNAANNACKHNRRLREQSLPFNVLRASSSSRQLPTYGLIGTTNPQNALMTAMQSDHSHNPTLDMNVRHHPITSMDAGRGIPGRTIAVDLSLESKQQSMINRWRQSIT